MKLQHYRRALVDGVSLSRAAVQNTIASLRRAGRSGLIAHRCVGPDRADYLLPGCAIFEAIHRLWQTSSVTVADRGLRDGMLLRMMRDANLQSGRPASPRDSAATMRTDGCRGNARKSVA